jgi:hypothetical protein
MRGRWKSASATVFGLSLAIVAPSVGNAVSPAKLKPGQCCPVVVKKPGSYILTGNLQPTSGASDGIQVKVSNVTIDLNGYSIIGPSQSGIGVGVNAAAQNNVTVKNGSVSGMGGSGVAVGTYGVVRNVTATGNGTSGSGAGIQCTGSACLVSDCIAGGNVSQGLTFLDSTSGYQGNVINGSPTPVFAGTDMGGNVCSGSPCSP